MRVQDLLGALEIAELHEDLSERGQRDGQAVAGAERLVQRDAALGERQRLIVAMAHQRDVRLVVDDAREDVVGGNRHRQTLALTQSRPWLRPTGRPARAAPPTASGRARDDGDRRRRAARTRLR